MDEVVAYGVVKGRGKSLTKRQLPLVWRRADRQAATLNCEVGAHGARRMLTGSATETLVGPAHF